MSGKFSRRAVIASGLSLAPAAVAAAMPPAAGDDAGLLALGKQFGEACAVERSMHHIAESFDHAGATCTPAQQEAARNYDAAWHDVTDIVADIMTTPAFTMAGLRIKARAARYMCEDDAGTPGHLDDSDLLESILIDLLRDAPAP
jgi:hypothetical protein